MNDLIYLNIVVHCFYLEDDNLYLVEIRTYSDNRMEYDVDGVLCEIRHFVTLEASDIPIVLEGQQ